MVALYAFAEFTLDSTRRLLTFPAGNTPLRPKTAALLEVFLRHPGLVLSKTELMERLWRDTVVTESSLYECINDARTALGDSRHAPRFIETIPKRGYCWIYTDVESLNPASGASPDFNGKTSVVSPHSSGPRQPADAIRRARQWAALILLVLIAAGLSRLAWPGASPSKEPAGPEEMALDPCFLGARAFQQDRFQTAYGHFLDCSRREPGRLAPRLDMAGIMLLMGDLARAEEMAREVVGLALDRADYSLVIKANDCLSRAAMARGDIRAARPPLLHNLELSKSLGWPRAEIRTRLRLAEVALHFGALEEGEAAAMEGLEHSLGAGMRSEAAELHLQLAKNAYERRQENAWLTAMKRALTALQDCSVERRHSILNRYQTDIARLARVRRDPPRAKDLLDGFQILAGVAEGPNSDALDIRLRAQREFVLGHYEGAATELSRVIASEQASPDSLDSVIDLLRLSLLRLAQHDLPEAGRLLEALRLRFAGAGEEGQLILILLKWGSVAGEFGYWRAANQCLAEVVARAKKLDNRAVLLESYLRLGWVAIQKGALAEAVDLASRARNLAEQQKHLEAAQYAEFLDAYAAFLSGDRPRALAFCQSKDRESEPVRFGIHPWAAQVAFFRFRVALSSGRMSLAEAFLDQIERLPPNGYNEPRSLLIPRAMLAEARGDGLKALCFLEQAIETEAPFLGIFPLLPDAHGLMVKRYAAIGEWRDGSQFLKQALLRRPESPWLRELAADYTRELGPESAPVGLADEH